MDRRVWWASPWDHKVSDMTKHEHECFSRKNNNKNGNIFTGVGIQTSFEDLDWGQEEKGTTEDEMAGWHH